MNLFKYFGESRVDVIQNLQIRFTPANRFNDPFECLPDTRVVEDSKWITLLENDVIPEILIKDMIKAAKGAERRWNEEKIRIAYRTRYPARIVELKQMAHAEMLRAREPLRILCLSQVAPDLPAALPMWGHYTGSHAGFAIEFDAQHEWMTAHLPVNGQPHDAGPVIYSIRRSTWRVDNGNLIPNDRFIFFKSSEWSYEKEYRLLRFAGTEGLDASAVDSLVNIPPGLIRRIVLGANSSMELRERVRGLCRQSHLAHVILQLANIHTDEYRVELRAL